MPRIAYSEELEEIGAEPLDGSGFDDEEPEAPYSEPQDAESEVAE